MDMAGNMDSVKAFNSELASLYETKPPISKAKMVAITKAALKAIKWYKHVVLSVEKFIAKCKADYKVPGLYVMDSIVRQSRHQFGKEKDVFGPRFYRNLEATIEALLLCPEEDKPRVVRVLNLWLKNDVYTHDEIAPLLAICRRHGLPTDAVEVEKRVKGKEANVALYASHSQQHHHHPSPKIKPPTIPQTKEEEPKNVLGEGNPNPALGNMGDPRFLQQIQQLTSSLLSAQQQQKEASEQKSVSAVGGLLSKDFEYSEDEDEGGEGGEREVEVKPRGGGGIGQDPRLAQPPVVHQDTDMRKPLEAPKPTESLPPPVQHKPIPAPVQPTQPDLAAQQAVLQQLQGQLRPGLLPGNAQPGLLAQPPPHILQQALLGAPAVQFPPASSGAPGANGGPALGAQTGGPPTPVSFPSGKAPGPPFNLAPASSAPNTSAPLLGQRPPAFPNPPKEVQDFSQPPPGMMMRPNLSLPPPGMRPPPGFRPPGPPGAPPNMQLPPHPPPGQPPPHLQIGPPRFPGPPPRHGGPPQALLQGPPRHPGPPPALPPPGSTAPTVPPPGAGPPGVGGPVGRGGGVPPPPGLEPASPFRPQLPFRPTPGVDFQVPDMWAPEADGRDRRRRDDDRERDRDRRERDRDRPERDRDRDRVDRDRGDRDRGDRDRGDRKRRRSSSRSRDRSRDRERRHKKRSRSRSRSRDRDGKKKKKSRDHSREDEDRESRKKSKRRSRSRSAEEVRERERERRKNGLPSLKPDTVSICSRTLWFGRIPNNCIDEDIQIAVQEYGQAEKIDIFPPRGCAYVMMPDRKSAYKVHSRLRDLNIRGRSIKIAWAQGKGVKGDEYKEFWDVDKGVTYIPHDQLPGDLKPLVEGGYLDLESLPEHLKSTYTEPMVGKPLVTSVAQNLDDSSSVAPDSTSELPDEKPEGAKPMMMAPPGFPMGPPGFMIAPPGVLPPPGTAIPPRPMPPPFPGGGQGPPGVEGARPWHPPPVPPRPPVWNGPAAPFRPPVSQPPTSRYAPPDDEKEELSEEQEKMAAMGLPVDFGGDDGRPHAPDPIHYPPPHEDDGTREEDGEDDDDDFPSDYPPPGEESRTPTNDED